MYDEVKRLSRYGIVGIATNLLLYVVFLLLLYLGVDPVVDAGICYLLGVSLSYILNRRWTFDSRNTHKKDLPKFLLSYGIGLISTLLTITVLMQFLPTEIGQLLNIAITAVVIYGCLKLTGFGKKRV